MTTARDICTTALRKTSVIGDGQDPGASDINDALNDLNGMIGQWQVRRWMIYHLEDMAFQGNNNQTFTIGPTGDIVVDKRPDRLETGCYCVQLIPVTPQLVSYPLTLIQAKQDWARITLKTLNTVPSHVFYDPTMPNGTVYPWPIPNNQWAVHLLFKQVLQRFATLDDVVALPDEYYEALVYNLCIRLATSYPDAAGAMSPEVKELAKVSLATVIAANAAIPTLVMPRTLTRTGARFNIYSGDYN